MNPLDIHNYKLGSEGFLSMYLDQYQLILGSDLENYAADESLIFNKENPSHIYFILRRPKVTIDPNSFRNEQNSVKFDFLIHGKEGNDTLNMVAEFPEAKTPLKLITKYPYNLFEIIDETDESHLFARPSSLIDHNIILDNVSPAVLDYEILYIGQAFGQNGEREAINRLSSHKTLQKISLHSLTENPESDVWILLTKFSQVSVLFGLGDDLVDKESYDKDKDLEFVDHFFSNNGFKFSDKQKINLTEAALIKYFEPKYNIEFKNNFPKANHKSYSEYYNLDIRAVNIELDTSELNRKLYTDKVPRTLRHSKMFELKDDKDRFTLFSFLQPT